MSRSITGLMLTGALCLPGAAMAQSDRNACGDLELVIVDGLPSSFEGQRDELVGVATGGDAELCAAQLALVRDTAGSDTGTTVADTAETTLTLQDEVTVEGAVLLDQSPPRVSVQSGETDVEIQPGSPTVTVAEGQGEIVVRQAPANVTIDMPVPTIRIEQAAPEIFIKMPDPNVTVGAAQPQVRVVQADPVITVTQSPPSVDLQLRRAEEGAESAGFRVTDSRTGQEYQPGAAPEAITTEDAEIEFTASEPRVTLTEPTEEAVVRIERNQPVIRFEQAEPTVNFASAGEPTIEFIQSGEPVVTFEDTGMASDAETAETPIQQAVATDAPVEPEADPAMEAEPAAEADPAVEVEPAPEAEPATTVETTAPVELAGPMVERDGYNMVPSGDIEVDTLIGMDVYGINDEEIGEIGDLVLSTEGQVEQVLIEVGGFLGLGEKNVAIPFEELTILRSNENDVRVYLDTTEDKLQAMPEFEG
jgi:sporulation protein YlmC with PRC-barrel domain